MPQGLFPHTCLTGKSNVDKESSETKYLGKKQKQKKKKNKQNKKKKTTKNKKKTKKQQHAFRYRLDRDWITIKEVKTLFIRF